MAWIPSGFSCRCRRVDGPVPRPADGQEPGPRPREVVGRRLEFASAAVRTLEPRRGRERIGLAERQYDAVAASVFEDVGKRVMSLARCAQDVVVIAIGEQRTGAAPERVEALRDAGRERLNRERELGPTARLAQQVDVVALHRVVNEPELVVGSRSHRTEGGQEHRVRCAAPQ